ncbi:MAG TPA: glycoside hydrolase family 15 protein [Stellaceae bacterium]|nr:glycoside hydrolase family 15 protein [Stellaceae bacterium]
MSALDLGVIGNCVIAALVSRTARIEWCCFPRLDGDPVFCSLLRGSEAEEGGFFDVAADGALAVSQRYRGNTAILETVIADRDGGAMRVVDFAPRFKRYGRIFRPAMLVRRIEPVEGRARVRLRLRPRFAYGARTPGRSSGSNHLRYFHDDAALRLTTDAPLSYLVDEVPFILSAPINLILGPDEPPMQSPARMVSEFLEETEEYWIDWTRYLSVPFEWQDAVIRAAVTLKLCSFEETGAIVAALTTSVPEAPDSARNWDYRYCWLRDAYFVVHALNRLGATRTMEDYLGFVTNVATAEAQHRLRPVYPVVPAAEMIEHEIRDLRGFRDMGPVRVGNAAALQRQNDVYGSVILAATQMFFDRRLPRLGDRGLFQDLERLGENAVELAFEPDASVWEYRGIRGVHTFSSVMCWAACNTLARLARRIGLADRAEHWREAARRIREGIESRAWDARRNTFVSAVGSEEVDASLLLLNEVGFLPADDPRFVGTVAAVERHLRRGNLLFRYAVPDDFGPPKTAFAACTFWFSDALAAIGRREEARAIFEEMLTHCNHLGLLSEDIDPGSGELWGNYPQTYSMVGLVITAMRLSRSWEEALWAGS